MMAAATTRASARRPRPRTATTPTTTTTTATRRTAGARRAPTAGCARRAPTRASTCCTTAVDNYWDDADIGCRPFAFGEVAEEDRRAGLRAHDGQADAVRRRDVWQRERARARSRGPRGLRQWNYVQQQPIRRVHVQDDAGLLRARGGGRQDRDRAQLWHDREPQRAVRRPRSKKNWRGSSWIEDTVAKAGNKAIITTAYYDCDPGATWEGEVTFDTNCKKHATFKPGEKIRFSIEQLLMLAGVTLDERVADGAVWADGRSGRARRLGCRTGAASGRTSRSS